MATTFQGRTFDRVPGLDPRNRDFHIRTVLRPNAKPRSYTWKCGVVLNQGSEGACVGFSVAHDGAARPCVVPGVTNDTARSIYRRAKQLDQFPGEDYEGSDVKAGVLAARERGWYGAFRWAFGIDDVILTLGHKGPVLLGIDWHEAMGEPDEKGFIRPEGEVVGGHAILANGVIAQPRGEAVIRLHNSWGPGWGVKGECFIKANDLATLLERQGEVCVPVERIQRTKP